MISNMFSFMMEVQLNLVFGFLVFYLFFFFFLNKIKNKNTCLHKRKQVVRKPKRAYNVRLPQGKIKFICN